MMTSSILRPSLQQSNAFEILKELPAEILERNIFLYCNGKSLSTLALACAAADSQIYEKITMITLLDYSSRLLLRVAHEIECTAVDTQKCEGAVRWIRSIAELDDDVLFPSASLEPPAQIASIQWRCQMMRRLSENLAVFDFLHQSMNESEYGKWEWPVWVGRISVKLPTTIIAPAIESLVVITSTLDYPSQMPVADIATLYPSVARQFGLEPMNFIPLPPWGQMRGICGNDEAKLRHMYSGMTEHGERRVSIPTYGSRIFLDEFNFKFLTRPEAKDRYDNAPYKFGRPPSSLWLLHDEPPSVLVRDRLVCCWLKHSTSEISRPRQYVEYIIALMNTRHRLVQESWEQDPWIPP